MKKIYAIITFCLTIVVGQSVATVKSDSVLLGPGYSDESYYSLANGVVKTAARATWDIAFRTMKMSSSIITNDGSGVTLYTYPKSDTAGWNTIDTTGLSSWTPMYNDPADWENGAFSRHASGHPDYGWGIYNMTTHNLTGDSLFIIKLRDGSFRKLWIVNKKSAANIYTFRYAGLDGSGEEQISLDLNPYEAEDFYGYSLQTNEKVSFQPAKHSWDILFTKYMSVQSNGTPYLVTGVLSNDTVSSKKFYPVPLSYSDFGAGSWDSTRSSVGWDWKVFDMNTFTYKVVDSTVYFIKPVNGDIYKLLFTAFAGSSTGLVKFDVNRAAGAGMSEPQDHAASIRVYPNPATTSIRISTTGFAGDHYTMLLTDLSGRQLRADHPGNLAGSGAYTMDVTGVQPGVYFITVLNAATRASAKVTIIR
jgi:predicted lipoprotein with Yx(FWY)xxD motif